MSADARRLRERRLNCNSVLHVVVQIIFRHQVVESEGETWRTRLNISWSKAECLLTIAIATGTLGVFCRGMACADDPHRSSIRYPSSSCGLALSCGSLLAILHAIDLTWESDFPRRLCSIFLNELFRQFDQSLLISDAMEERENVGLYTLHGTLMLINASLSRVCPSPSVSRHHHPAEA